MGRRMNGHRIRNGKLSPGSNPVLVVDADVLELDAQLAALHVGDLSCTLRVVLPRTEVDSHRIEEPVELIGCDGDITWVKHD